MSVRNPVIVWRNEMRPDELPHPEPPFVPFAVTRSEIVQSGGTGRGVAVHIWYAAVPDSPVTSVQENTEYLRKHGKDLIPVRLIDLLSAITRMEQVSREPDFEINDLTHERIFTCDLPRLRRYLPDGAQAILGEEGW